MTAVDQPFADLALGAFTERGFWVVPRAGVAARVDAERVVGTLSPPGPGHAQAPAPDRAAGAGHVALGCPDAVVADSLRRVAA